MKTMKTSIRIIAVSLAASLALVSCAKQDAMDNGSANPAGGARTIAVSFANASVKSELGEDGLTPKFVATDVIKVSNGTATEECNVSIEGDVASITTKLSGALTMVYPAAAAKMNSENPNKIDGILVPTVQDGTFASANICKASIDEDATSASFENQTAVLRFYVDASIGVKSIAVSSTAADIAYGSKTITVDPEGDVTLDAVTDDPGRRICYVSVLPVAESTNLTFSSVTTTQTTYPDNTVSRTVSSTTMEKNKIYNAFIPYYIDFGTAGKWAYCNIGAFLPEDYGEYFAWGETTGHKANSAKTGFEDGHSFDWSNAPFNNGQSSYDGTYFNSVKDTECPGGILALRNDAANVNWGGSWRMPKSAEFTTLYNACGGTGTYLLLTALGSADPGKGIYWVSAEQSYIKEYTGVAGLLFCDDNGNKLFIPAAGSGSDDSLGNVGSGLYLSSSLYSSNPSYACFLNFISVMVKPQVGDSRKFGRPVRPLSD